MNENEDLMHALLQTQEKIVYSRDTWSQGLLFMESWVAYLQRIENPPSSPVRQCSDEIIALLISISNKCRSLSLHCEKSLRSSLRTMMSYRRQRKPSEKDVRVLEEWWVGLGSEEGLKPIGATVCKSFISHSRNDSTYQLKNRDNGKGATHEEHQRRLDFSNRMKTKINHNPGLKDSFVQLSMQQSRFIQIVEDQVRISKIIDMAMLAQEIVGIRGHALQSRIFRLQSDEIIDEEA